MYKLSERCEKLKKDTVYDRPNDSLISFQRDFHFITGAVKAAEPAEASIPAGPTRDVALVGAALAPGALDYDIAYLTARGLVNTIDNFMPIIGAGELLVGHNYGELTLSDDDGRAAAQLRDGMFDEEQISRFLANRVTFNGIMSHAFSFDEGAESAVQSDRKARQLNEEMASMGYMITDNHTVIGYEKVLRLGFEGILEELDGKSGGFYDNMRAVCAAACRLGDKYADKAGELLRGNAGGYEPEDLESIIRNCRRVPRKPARTFAEAVQSLWFAHIINTWEDGINANSLGRLDQILYPYYAADLENGRLTKESAFEIICLLWLKLYRDYDVQQSCVGGCDGEGLSAVNELSYLMLDATDSLGLIRCLSVRFSHNTEKEFVARALETVGRLKNGIPFFFNDDVMIPALTSRGVSVRDARGYTQIGCVETVIPGKSNPHAVTARCNLLKAVEYALCGGKSMINPQLCPGAEGGGVGAMRNFGDFKNAVFTQIKHIVEKACEMTVNCVPAAAKMSPKPYKSMLTEGCAESGRDFNDRGAKYDYYQVMLMGIPNLADSVAAVRELVFERKLYTLDELFFHLQNNFPDEAVRLDFVNKAPKFGNDIDEVDSVAYEIMDYSCELLKEISDRTGFSFHAQPFTFLWMVDHGLHTAATPDGRRNGEILAYSVSPMQGRDSNGFTALLNSVAKLPTTKAPGTASAIVEADPLLFAEKNIPRLTDILYGAAAKGLANAQFNVTDADTLIDAQKHPEKHRNLAVRVSGFSQRFDLIGKPLQDHIIARTKHRAV